MDTITKLNKLAELYSQKDVIALQKQELVDNILTPEIKAQIEDVNIEFADKLSAIDDTAGLLEAEIRAEVIQAGDTIKGDHMMAVFNKPRVSWDTKKLDGMIALIPQIAVARKEGEPSVAIRRMG